MLVYWLAKKIKSFYPTINFLIEFMTESDKTRFCPDAVSIRYCPDTQIQLSGQNRTIRYSPFLRTFTKFLMFVFHHDIIMFVQDPVSPQNWTTVRNCTSDGMSCFQPADMFQTEILSVVGMSEDCLFLNVYTPEVGVKLLVLTLINHTYVS